MKNIGRSVGLGLGVGVGIIAAVFMFQYFYYSGYRVPPPGEQYINEQYGFTFTQPQGFSVRETNNALVLADAEGNGLQIVITPLGKDIPVLDEARIRVDLPELKIADPQVVTIAGAGTGLAFKSTNAAFNGASREVWFVHNRNLYQIITYEHLGLLLSAVFGTLKFSVGQ